MDPKAVVKAKGRLRVAARQLEVCGQAANHDDFSGSWYLFLVAAKNVYTTLEQGSKSSPQSRQWFGAKKSQRKADTLLQYLFQARDDDEHGLGEVTRLEPGHLAIGVHRPGMTSSTHMSFSMETDEHGNLIKLEAKSLDGKPVAIEHQAARAVLLPVTGRGNIVYNPPTQHLGSPLSDQLPLTVGKAGLDYLEALVEEASQRPE